MVRLAAGARFPRGVDEDQARAERRRIPDTTTCTKPPYFGRTIAFKRGLVFRVLGRLAHVAVAERTVALLKDAIAESPAPQSS